MVVVDRSQELRAVPGIGQDDPMSQGVDSLNYSKCIVGGTEQDLDAARLRPD
jgi:hypothetical protein